MVTLPEKHHLKVGMLQPCGKESWKRCGRRVSVIYSGRKNGVEDPGGGVPSGLPSGNCCLGNTKDIFFVLALEL